MKKTMLLVAAWMGDVLFGTDYPEALEEYLKAK